MGLAEADHYAILGVDEGAAPAEIRRAFRRLALLHHPDRAGDDSTPVFQRVARAYAVLSDATSRATYDATRRARVGDWIAGGGRSGAGTRARAGAHGPEPAYVPPPPGGRDALADRLSREGQLIARLSRPLDDLVADSLAVGLADDEIELWLTPDEAARGGVALIDMRLAVACSTCGGVARPRGFFCRRCDSTGQVREVLTVYCAIPPRTVDGTRLSIPTEAAGATAPVQMRLRVLG